MNAEKSIVKWFLFILLSLIWGSSFILMKKGLAAYSYLDAATIRIMAAGMTLLPLGIRHFAHIPAHKRKYIVLSGAIGMFIPAFLFCFAQQQITSTTAGILNALTPVFTFLFALLIFKLPFKPWQGIGVFIGLASSVFLVMNRGNGSVSLNTYALLPVLATLLYGLNVNISKERLGDVPPMVVATTTVTAAGLLAFGLVFLPRLMLGPDVQFHLWPFLALCTLGIVGTAIAQVLFLQLLAHTSALFASSVTYLMPIVAIFWGLLDGEKFAWEHALGIVGILLGVVLIRKA